MLRYDQTYCTNLICCAYVLLALPKDYGSWPLLAIQYRDLAKSHTICGNSVTEGRRHIFGANKLYEVNGPRLSSLIHSAEL
jgi:hypothetical protein